MSISMLSNICPVVVRFLLEQICYKISQFPNLISLVYKLEL